MTFYMVVSVYRLVLILNFAPASYATLSNIEVIDVYGCIWKSSKVSRARDRRWLTERQTNM